MEELKTIKSKILNTKSKRMQEQLQLGYSIKGKEIKKCARHDKRAHVYCNEGGNCCRERGNECNL